MIRIPASQFRPETGPIQIGDDWPGVFIRGDEALFFAESLRKLRKLPPDCQRILIEDIASVLASCEVGIEVIVDRGDA